MKHGLTRRILIITLAAFTLPFLARAIISNAAQDPAALGFNAPEFTQTDTSAWHNSKPLNRKAFLGHVTLIDFWTFECWNCYRSFPWLHDVEQKFKGTDFQVIGIHSPEFDREKEVSRVAQKIREFKLEHPIMMDNDMAYWRAMHNRYWPAFYLIDRRGKVRHLFVGETHADTHQAAKIEKSIRQLLAEK
ncbi:MAG: redoxin domain-containing protein [Gammaproteobacteria bacterium]